jgi:hypothetical protein
MTTITPPAAPAELADWLSHLPPDTVLLDRVRRAWQVRIAHVGLDHAEVGVLQVVDSTVRWEQNNPEDMAVVAAHLPFLVVHSPAPPPVIWVHDGVMYDLGRALRGPAPTDCHWRWVGRFSTTGEPLLTPIGTGDEDLIGSESEFSSVARTEGRLTQSPPAAKTVTVHA